MAQDLSKRGKVGDVYRGGSYKKAAKKGYKTTGLTRKQMGKATTLKGKALTKKQKTRASELKSISDTKWVKGKGVVGKNGKAFTGTVQLASGKTASYVKGRRVGVNTKKKTTNPPPGPYKPPPGGATTTSSSSAGNQWSAAQVAAYKGAMASSGKRITPAQRKAAALRRSAARSAGRTRAQNSGPRVGEERTVRRSGVVAIERWNGTKWVTKRVVRS